MIAIAAGVGTGGGGAGGSNYQFGKTGWYMLGLLTCCIGVIFLRPYIDTTMTELYNDLSKNALDKGLFQSSELGVVPG